MASGGDKRVFAGLFVHWFRREVDAVRPGDCACFGVDGDLCEVGRVVQRRQDAGPALGGEVDVAGCAVAEQQAQHMVADHGDAGYDWQVCLTHIKHSTAVALWRAVARSAGLRRPVREQLRAVQLGPALDECVRSGLEGSGQHYAVDGD